MYCTVPFSKLRILKQGTVLSCRWQLEHSNLMLGNLEPTFITKGSTKHNSGRNSAATTAEGLFFFFFFSCTQRTRMHPYLGAPAAHGRDCTVPECIAGSWTKHGTGQSILRARPRLIRFFSPYSPLKTTRLIF